MPPPTPRSTSTRDFVGVALALVWLVAFGTHFFARPVASGFPVERIDLLADAHWLLMDNVSPPPDELARNSGWRYFPQRIDLLFVAGTMLLAAWSAGQLLLRAIRIAPATTVETTVFAFGLGLSAWSLLTLAAGLAGAMSRVLFIGLMLAVIAGESALRIRQRRAIADKRPTRSDRLLDRRFLGGPRLPFAVSLAIAPFLLAMLLGAMLPTTDFDVKEYHLQGPKEWYQQGRISFLPHNVYTSFPFLTEMLSLWGMVLRGDWFRGALIGQVVLMAFAPLTALAIYAIVRRVSSTAGWLAAGVFLTIPWIYRISIIAYAEGGLTFYVSATYLAWFCLQRDLTAGLMGRSALLCGLLAGSAIACKYPGLVSVTMPAGVAVVVSAARSRGMTDIRAAVRAAAVFSLGVAISFGPWALKNLIQTGNPVYPLAYTIFGGRDWTPELNEKWRHAHGAKVDWRNPVGIPADLWNQAQEVAVNTPLQSPLAFGLAPLALLSLLRRRRTRNSAPAPDATTECSPATPSLVRALMIYAAWLFLTWWALTHRIDRFWLPMLPIICALAGIGGGLLAERLERLFETGRRFAAIAGMLAFAGLAILATAYNLVIATSAQFGGFNAYLLDETATRRIAMQQTPSIALLESRLPDGARALLIGEAAVFDAGFDLRYNTVFDFELLQDWATDDPLSLHKEDIPLKSRAQILAALHERGITHVFVNWMEILRYREYGSYTYTDFISPRTIKQLVDMGVLEPVRLSPQERLTLFGELSPSKQQEIEAWAPELRTTHDGYSAAIAYELFIVAQD